eukprot:jgi/Ulvmu1/2928/UM149_0007.1
MPSRHVPASIAAPAAMVRTRNNVRPARVAPAYDEEEEATQCPLCCENLDETEKKHRPCPCGYQVCLFCFSRLEKEYGNRCPGCRTMYGTDPEEWERQRDARAKEAQAQKPQHTPRRPSRAAAAHEATASPSRSPSRATPRDDGDRPTRRDSGALRGQQDGYQRHAVPAIVQERPVDVDWPSLSQGPARAAPGPAPQAAQTPAADAPARSRPTSTNVAQAAQRLQKSPKPSTLNLPVNVQSLVNGTNTSLETVIDLSPPSGELHTYVQRDVQPLLQQLMSLKSISKAGGQPNAVTSRHTGAVQAANRRQNAGGAPAAPPGLERREHQAQAPQARQSANAVAAAGRQNPSTVWPQQQVGDQAVPQDAVSSAFRHAPVAESFAKQSGALPNGSTPHAMSGQTSAPANLPQALHGPALPPPPGLGPPPGFGPAPTAAAHVSIAGPSMLPPPGQADPSDGQTSNRNILHELFLQDNTGKLGWFSKPPGFEGNLHQLLDTSAPLAQLMRPVRNAARNRRPLYARAADAASVAASQEDLASGQPGSSVGEEAADPPRDPVVSLGRKLGGRHAEIGASLH